MKNEQGERNQLAHELRNTLTGIYGYAQLLEFSLAETGSEKDRTAARAIVAGAKKMDALLTQHINTQKKRKSGAQKPHTGV